MSSRSYSFLDVAALASIGPRFAAGEAIVVLDSTLSTVLWANGAGARLMGAGDLLSFIGSDPALRGPVRRQIEATSGFPRIGRDRNLLLRLAGGLFSRTTAFSASEIEMPDGEAAIMLATSAARPQPAGAIDGLSGDGQFAALIDGAGGLAAAADGFSELGIGPATLAALAAEVQGEADRTVKRPLPSARGTIPAGIVLLRDEPPLSLLVVVDEAMDEADLATAAPVQPAGPTDAPAAEAETAVAPEDAPSAALPGETVPAGDDAPAAPAEAHEPWYFNGVRTPEAAGAPDAGTPGDEISTPEEMPALPAQNFSEREDEAEVRNLRPPVELASVPVRFVWRTDAAGRFTAISDEFRAAFGDGAADVMGRRFVDVAQVFDLDPQGEIAGLLARRDTWSGRAVLWPVTGTDLRVPVDLAALPVYDRDRNFEGFRGFGVARMADAVVDPEALGLALAGATPDDGAATQADPFRGEVPALAVTPTPERRESDKVIRLAERRPGTQRDLSAAEQNIFREIGNRLRDSGLADEPAAPQPDPLDAADAEISAVLREAGPAGEAQEVQADMADARPAVGAEFLQPPLGGEPVAAESTGSAPIPAGEPAQDEESPTAYQAQEEPEHEATAGIESPATELPAIPAEAVFEAMTDAVADDDGIAPPADFFPAETATAGHDVAAALPEGAADRPEFPAEPVVESRDHDPAPTETIDLGAFAAASYDRPSGEMQVAAQHDEAIAASVDRPPATGEISDSDPAVEDTVDAPDAYSGDEEAEAAAAQPAEEGIDAARGAADRADVPGAVAAQDEAAALAGIAGDELEARADDMAAQARDDVGPDSLADTVAAETGAVAAQEPGTGDGALPEHDEIDRDTADLAPMSLADLAGVEQTSAEAPDEAAQDAPLPDLRGVDTAVLARLPLPILVHRGDTLHFANREFLQLTGYASLEELDGAGGLGALFAEPYGDGGERKPMLRTKAGGELPVSAFLQSVAWQGGKALLLSLKPDETRAAQMEAGAEREARLAELRTIIDTATDGVVLIENDGTIRSISRPAEALFGIESEEVHGKPFATLFAMESQRAARDYLAGLAGNGVASVLNDGREVIGREAQGRFIPLFMTIGRLPEQSGFCAVVRDITQFKRTEEELTQARAQAEHTSSQKTEFLARVSHEIRTPLNAIIGFSELMLDEKFGPITNERYKDYLRDINRSGNHVLDLVNDLLDISKIEAGQLELNYEAVSLNETLAEAVAMMQPQANRERVIIRSSFASKLPDVVADLRSVKQIALNLLSNAIRYTPAGGQVIVSTSYEPAGDLVMRVRDTGIGMAAAEIEQALKPFKQINALKRPRGDGTGLGLPLTKAMVEANRARFAIQSTPGEGTLVEITFPSTRVLAH